MVTASRFEQFVAWAERHHRTLLLSLIAIELVLGVAYSASLGGELRYWDEREYTALATSLLTRHEFRFGADLAFRPPLYPMLLAAFGALGGTVLTFRLLNFVFLGATMWLLDRIATTIARPFAGLVAAAWVLLDPVTLYTAGTLYPQTFAGLLLVLFVALIVREPPASLVPAGLVFALLLLTVPSFAALLGVVLAWLFFARRARALRSALELAAGACLPLAAWTLRNHAMLGSWVFVATNSGLNLLFGNCDAATPDSGVNADITRYVNAAASLGEIDRDHYYRDMAVRWIHENPGRAALLYAGKFAHYFSANDRLATASEASAFRTLAATLAYLPLELGMVARVALARRFPMKPGELLLLSLYLVNGLLAAVFFTRVRLRLPVDFLILGLLGCLAALATKQRSGDAA